MCVFMFHVYHVPWSLYFPGPPMATESCSIELLPWEYISFLLSWIWSWGIYTSEWKECLGLHWKLTGWIHADHADLTHTVEPISAQMIVPLSAYESHADTTEWWPGMTRSEDHISTQNFVGKVLRLFSFCDCHLKKIDDNPNAVTIPKQSLVTLDPVSRVTMNMGSGWCSLTLF